MFSDNSFVREFVFFSALQLHEAIMLGRLFDPSSHLRILSADPANAGVTLNRNLLPALVKLNFICIFNCPVRLQEERVKNVILILSFQIIF